MIISLLCGIIREAGEEKLPDLCIRTASKVEVPPFLRWSFLDINDLDAFINKRWDIRGSIPQRVGSEKLQQSADRGFLQLSGRWSPCFQSKLSKRGTQPKDQIWTNYKSRSFPIPWASASRIHRSRQDMSCQWKINMQMMKCICQKRLLSGAVKKKPLYKCPTMKVRICASFPMMDLLLSARCRAAMIIYVCTWSDDPSCLRYSRAMVEEFDLPSEIVHDAATYKGRKNYRQHS